MPKAGSKAPESGIYECVKCDSRKAIKKGARIPPCRRCDSASWRLVDATTGKRKGKQGVLGSITRWFA